MALRALPETPYMPQPVQDAPQTDAVVTSLAKFSQSLVPAIWRYAKDIAFRVNRVLPKDGSEAMEGTLNLGVPGKIKFPAVQSASTDANTLDDYEEGSFTPTVLGSTTPGTYTYTTQAGQYIKIGKKVWFSIRVTVNTVTTAGTGNTRFQALPFTNVSSTTGIYVGFANIIATLPANFGGWTGTISTTQVVLRYFNSSTGVTNEVPISAIGAGTDFIFSGVYEASA